MVANRLKKICTNAIGEKFPELKIVDFEIRKTYKYVEETENWVDDSYSIFIQLEVSYECSLQKLYHVEKYLNALFGFECCIDFSWN
jgi:hypothetical protein